MNIEDLRVMSGPNMWSDQYHKLIIVKPGFLIRDREQAAKHYKVLRAELGEKVLCKSDHENPFVDLTAALASLAAYLQPHGDRLFSECMPCGEKKLFAVFEYEEEKAGTEAAHAAIDIINQVISGKPVDLVPVKSKIAETYRKTYMGTSTKAIVDTAVKKGIPARQLGIDRYIVFGYGKFQKRIEASIAETTSAVAMDIAGNKHLTKQILDDLMIPVPTGINVRNEEELPQAVSQLGFPLVTKPLDGHEGQGITANINNEESLLEGFSAARQYSRTVVVERFIRGNDYRFLVIGYKLRGVIQREPASVTGDGISTIQELVDVENENPLRGPDPDNPMAPIEIDEHTLHVLAENKMNPDSVPAKDEVVYLKRTANVSTGGTPIDVTEQVHADNIEMAERIARIIGLDVCGIDIMAPDITTPIEKNGGAVIEVNASPGLRMHLDPVKGKPRDVTGPIVDLMYPRGSRSRIPIVAVTGTNGKTTTVRLMAHLAMQQGTQVGYTCTDGIYINDKEKKEGDCSGSESARVVLSDPEVGFAVLECARGGIIRTGLGFDRCDVGIVTNIDADHIGLKDIDSLEDLARVKAVVPRAVAPDGYAILNAADDRVYNMRQGLKCNVALFCIDHLNPRLLEHCMNGGLAATVNERQEIMIMMGNGRVIVEHVENIPLTLNGKAGFMIENILPAVLASFVLGFNMQQVNAGLRSFKPSDTQTPGRMNLFDINGVNVLVDYAHNPHGLRATGKYLGQIAATKTGIVTGVGDRRDDDIVEMGKAAADIYDRIIIRMDDDMRGRTHEEMRELLSKGIQQTNGHIPVEVIPDGKKALEQAIGSAKKGDYIIVNTENVKDTIAYVKQLQQKSKEL